MPILPRARWTGLYNHCLKKAGTYADAQLRVNHVTQLNAGICPPSGPRSQNRFNAFRAKVLSFSSSPAVSLSENSTVTVPFLMNRFT